MKMKASLKENESLSARALWYMVAKTIAFAVSFALPVILVRSLSRHEFGLYKQVFLIIGTAVSVLPLGIGMSAFYFLPRQKAEKGAIVLNIAVFYLVTGGAIFAGLTLYPAVLGRIFNSPDLIQYAPLIGLVMLLWTLSSFLETAAVANEETRLATVFIVGGQLSKTVLLLAAAILFTTVASLIWAALLQGLIQTIVLFAYLKRRFWKDGMRFRWSVLKDQLSYAIPFGVAGITLRLYSDLDSYFVSWRFGATLYATYAIGCFDLPLIDILTYSVGSVTLPRVSHLHSLGRTREIVELLARAVRKMAAICLPIYCFMVIEAKSVIELVFTSRYLDSWPIFVINLTMIPLAILSSAYDPVIRAFMEHRFFVVKVRAALAVMLILFLWAGTTWFGLIGAIAAVITICLAERIVMTVKAARILGLARSDLVLIKDVGKILISCGVACVSLLVVNLGLQGTPLLYLVMISGFVFSIVYLGALLVFHAPTDAERRAVKRFLGHWLRPLAAKGEADVA